MSQNSIPVIDIGRLHDPGTLAELNTCARTRVLRPAHRGEARDLAHSRKRPGLLRQGADQKHARLEADLRLRPGGGREEAAAVA